MNPLFCVLTRACFVYQDLGARARDGLSPPFQHLIVTRTTIARTAVHRIRVCICDVCVCVYGARAVTQ